MFLWKGRLAAISATFLCLRRGVSTVRAHERRLGSLFSAYAEVFPRCGPACSAESAFLCLRRGVSPPSSLAVFLLCFSLPTQRCFLRITELELELRLFSAYAEVFLGHDVFVRSYSSFLCLRRGVSTIRDAFEPWEVFSLPTQRCFRPRLTLNPRRLLFSAYAEVFLGE